MSESSVLSKRASRLLATPQVVDEMDRTWASEASMSRKKQEVIITIGRVLKALSYYFAVRQ